MSIETFKTSNQEEPNFDSASIKETDGFESIKQEQDDRAIEICKSLNDKLHTITQSLPEHLYPELLQKFDEVQNKVYDEINAPKDVDSLIRPLLDTVSQLHKERFNLETEEQLLFTAESALAEILDQYNKEAAK